MCIGVFKGKELVHFPGSAGFSGLFEIGADLRAQTDAAYEYEKNRECGNKYDYADCGAADLGGQERPRLNKVCE